MITRCIPPWIPLVDYHVRFSQKEAKDAEALFLIDYQFTSHDVICLSLAALVGLWYLLQKVSTRTHSDQAHPSRDMT